MTRKNTVAWLLTALFVAGTAFAQSPAPVENNVNVDAAASPAAPAAPVENNVQVDAAASPAAPAAAAPAESRTDINVNRTETVHETSAPAPAGGGTSTTVWGFDGKTVLIGGALLLGIILIAVAAAGRDRDTTTVVR